MATRQQCEPALPRLEMGQQTKPKQDIEPLKKAAKQAGDFGNRARAALKKL